MTGCDQHTDPRALPAESAEQAGAASEPAPSSSPKPEVFELDTPDGADEVLVGIWSNKPRHDEPQPHRTVWVLGLRDGKLYERWRGSALGRPLRDFEVDESGKNELLVAREQANSIGFRTRYKWTGFGFAGVDSTKVDCAGQ